MVKRPRKILIVRTDRLGDVILSTPVIKNLKLAFPEVKITFMCRPYTQEALSGNPWLDEVIVYDKYGKDKSFFSTVRFSFFLRKQKFDWAIILHPTNRAHILTFLAGIRLRIGWDRKLGFLLNRKLLDEKNKGKKHELGYSLDVLRSLDIPVRFKDTYFPLNRDSEARLEKLLSEKGLSGRDDFIVIHPSASCPSKRWPLDYFAELINLLREKTKFKVILVSSEKEKEIIKKLIDLPGVVDLSGRLSISDLGFLLKKAQLFISNDSGPVHIAASLNTPVISIFGRKDPGLSPLRWRPLGENSFYLHKDVGCDTCLAHNCQKGFQCLYEIKPPEVFVLAREILAKRSKWDERA